GVPLSVLAGVPGGHFPFALVSLPSSPRFALDLSFRPCLLVLSPIVELDTVFTLVTERYPQAYRDKKTRVPAPRVVLIDDFPRHEPIGSGVGRLRSTECPQPNGGDLVLAELADLAVVAEPVVHFEPCHQDAFFRGMRAASRPAVSESTPTARRRRYSVGL